MQDFYDRELKRTNKILLHLPLMQYNISEINHLMKHRRSVFVNQFDHNKQVDDLIIKQLLENATYAPTHGKTEPWHFVVFSGEGRKKLADFQSTLYKEEAGEKFTTAKYEKLKQQPLQVSHIIAICLKRHESSKIPEIEEVEAVACAVQNIYLSVTAYNLGGYWSSGGITYMNNAKPFFGLKEADRLLGFFFIGHVATPSAPVPRAAWEEKVVWVK